MFLLSQMCVFLIKKNKNKKLFDILKYYEVFLFLWYIHFMRNLILQRKIWKCVQKLLLLYLVKNKIVFFVCVCVHLLGQNLL